MNKQRSQTRRTYFRRSISRDRYMGDNSKRELEKLLSDKDLGSTPRQYRHRSEDRAKNLHRHRRSRTHSRSHTRSRERSSRIGTQSSEQHKYRHEIEENNRNDEKNLTQPQIIAIPVPVPADFMNYANLADSIAVGTSIITVWNSPLSYAYIFACCFTTNAAPNATIWITSTTHTLRCT
nr:ATP-dependent RNA helicase DHX8-like isoform X2 [Bactrocera oleae]XP_036220721.1 ATP-dependent RNA helicase DHX8-like isoform X2 [Bactrocera oleae]